MNNEKLVEHILGKTVYMTQDEYQRMLNYNGYNEVRKSVAAKLQEQIDDFKKLVPSESVVLSESQWDQLQEILEQPPEPNEKLAEIMRKHRYDDSSLASFWSSAPEWANYLYCDGGSVYAFEKFDINSGKWTDIARFCCEQPVEMIDRNFYQYWSFYE